jgi:[ribosomal protein S5]-alanine N-acetyltransferase
MQKPGPSKENIDLESEMNYFQQVSERLIFRKLTHADIPTWQSFFVGNDRLVFLGIDATQSHKVLAKEWIDRQLQRYAEEGTGLLAVIEKSSGELIGMCGILKREIEEELEYEIAYSFLPKFWKKGYATEAAKQMKKFGAETELSNRFISIIHKDNTDSIAVAQRNGMQPVQATPFHGNGSDYFWHGNGLKDSDNFLF